MQENKEIEDKNKALAVYLMEHKEMRPLQNVRNFYGFPYLLKAEAHHFNEDEWIGIKDTFYE